MGMAHSEQEELTASHRFHIPKNSQRPRGRLPSSSGAYLKSMWMQKSETQVATPLIGQCFSS